MKTETTVTSVSPKEMPETANSTRIQTYSKSQLATLYLLTYSLPRHAAPSAVGFTQNTALQAALAQTGYSEKAILLTPAQVGLFFKFLGEP